MCRARTELEDDPSLARLILQMLQEISAVKSVNTSPHSAVARIGDSASKSMPRCTLLFVVQAPCNLGYARGSA